MTADDRGYRSTEETAQCRKERQAITNRRGEPPAQDDCEHKQHDRRSDEADLALGVLRGGFGRRHVSYLRVDDYAETSGWSSTINSLSGWLWRRLGAIRQQHGRSEP